MKAGKRNTDMIRIIRNEQDYDNMAVRIQKLMHMHPEEGSKEHEELEVLVTLMEHYEARHFPELPSDPVLSIKIKMEELGLKQADLIPELGSASRVSEILNYKRDMTKEQVWNISKRLELPLELLMSPYQLAVA